MTTAPPVAGDESVSAVVGQVLERFGRPDVLVNNAGVGANGVRKLNRMAG
ncbi:hypothetical protein [Lentzea aerocolonigenes]|nr:hypothetical protein [Lentzea aerocolonigenes]MCP2243534.1 hypothetical protein [Lentzea aerocolonigenes]